MADLLSLKNVNKIYGDKVKTQVLSDINVSFQQREFSAIIGQSGSGKSTMLNIIGTLDRPTSGGVYALGRDLTGLSDDQLAVFRNRMMGFIFQFHYLLPEFTALENVLIPFWLGQGSPPAEKMKLARELLERVGVAERMNNKSTDLSGGQQQRVAIARALINRPRLILADEPTGNLDSDSAAQVNELMREINQEFGTTFIIVTHDRHIAAQCDRVIEIKDGRIVQDYLTAGKDHKCKWDDLAPSYCEMKKGNVEWKESVKGTGV